MASIGDSNASINEILSLLKHYRHEQSSQCIVPPPQFETLHPSQPTPPLDSSFELRLHASLDKLKPKDIEPHPNTANNIYQRLHQEVPP